MRMENQEIIKRTDFHSINPFTAKGMLKHPKSFRITETSEKKHMKTV